MDQSGAPLPTPKPRPLPLAVFAMVPGVTQASLDAAFTEGVVQVMAAENEAQLRTLIEKPHCLCVFWGFDPRTSSLHQLRDYTRHQGTRWITVSGALSKEQTQTLKEYGAYRSLTLPVPLTRYQEIIQELITTEPEAEAEIVDFKAQANWNRLIWPVKSLPDAGEGDGKTYAHRELGSAIKLFEKLFQDCCRPLSAERITLISLKEQAIFFDTRCPAVAYVLVSSDDALVNNQQIPTDAFPQIIRVFERRGPTVFNFKAQANQAGPSSLNYSSAALPAIVGTNFIEAVMLIQFAHLCDKRSITLLEEASTFLRIPEAGYKQIDFMSRVYRGQAFK